MLGNKIKELRKTNGLTQKELAAALNVTFQAVSLWEKDLTDPDIINIKLLAKYFDITIDELMDFDIYDYQSKNAEGNVRHARKEKKPK